ncbi:unnamed protein product, partial [Sphacelaria rigidula]
MSEDGTQQNTAAPAGAPTGEGSPAGSALAPIFTSRRGPPAASVAGPTRNFPEDVPEAVRAAVTNFVPAEGLYHAPAPTGKPSILHFWGVRLDTKPEREWKRDAKNKNK